jgi:hypothetical protein
VFWVISVYFNIRNTLPKFVPFLLGHPLYAAEIAKIECITVWLHVLNVVVRPGM